MDIYGKISEKIKNISGKQLSDSFIQPAEVLSVSGETCTVKIDTLTVTDVRLRAVINGNSDKILITPKVGSYVLVADLSGGNYRDLAVIAFSEIEDINVEAGGENLFTVLSDFITEVAKIIVVQGTSPNVAALEQINQRLNKILK